MSMPLYKVMWLVLLVGSHTAVFSQPEIEFTRCLVATNREVLLTLTAPSGRICRIEASTDLAQWSALVTLASTGANQYTDSAAPFVPVRYYRGCELIETSVLTGDHIEAGGSDIIVHPVNHASLVLAWKGTVVSIDPVGSAYYRTLPKADLVLITHDHSDHLDTSAISQNLATNGVIGAPTAVYSKLTQQQRSVTCILNNGVVTNLAGLLIEVVPAYNTNSSPFHPRGSGNGYVLTLAERRIYVSGDTHNTPEMNALRDIDIAFLAMNQPYTMTVPMAVSAVRAFRPRIVYPYHYRPGSGYPSTDLATFKREVLANPGVEVRLREWY